MSRILSLQSQLTVAAEKAEGIVALADQEGRDLTAAEEKEFNEAVAATKRLQAQIAKAEKQDADLAAFSASGRRTAANVPGAANLHHQDDYPGRKTGRVPAEPKGRQDGGFENLGEFGLAIIRACSPGGYHDPRLQQLATPSTYASEGSGAEGGWLVPPDLKAGIMTKVMAETSLLSMTTDQPVSGNTMLIIKDNSVPWGTTGVRMSWLAEGALKTQTAPSFEFQTLKLAKGAVLLPVTDELLEDAPAMEGFLKNKGAEAVDFGISLAIVQGTGVNQPLGILNSTALISVAKTGSQVADTVVAQNILDMYSRMYAPSRSSAVWLINQSIEPFLNALSMPGRDNTGAAVTGWGFPVYIPAGGFSTNPYASLFGRPVIPTQTTNELGDKGDIIFADLKQYATSVKAGGPKTEVSIHLWFDYDITAFRIVIRMNGAPLWDSPVSPRDGSTTLSPFVTLDERAG